MPNIRNDAELIEDFATRQNRLDTAFFWGSLPDPDPVLIKTGKDIEAYRDLTSDAHVWACLQSRKAGTLAREWEVTSPKGISIPVRKIKTISKMLDNIDIYSAISDMLDAPFYGISPIEISWKQWAPVKMQGKPPEWFVFDIDNNPRFISMDSMIEGEPLPDFKFLIPTHFASYQNPYGERLLSRCFWPVVFKRGGWNFWNIFCEKYGMPWAVGKVPRGTSGDDRAALLGNLRSMVQNGCSVINNDESIEHPTVGSRSASADIYEKLISTANREISKAILGQTLTTEIDKGGSYAATQSHMQIRSELTEQDQKMICNQLNLLLQWISDFNFAPGPAPIFRFIEDKDIKKDVAERDSELTNQGVKFKKQYYQREYGFNADDFDIEQIAAPSETRQAPEFAEASSTSADVIDRITDSALDDVVDGAVKFYAPVKKLLAKSDDLLEFRDGLLNLFDDMDEKDLAEAMGEAFVMADLSGRFKALK